MLLFVQSKETPVVFEGITSRYDEHSQHQYSIREIKGVDRNKFRFNFSPYVGQHFFIHGKNSDGNDVPCALVQVIAGKCDFVDFRDMKSGVLPSNPRIGDEFQHSLMRREKTLVRMIVPEVRCTTTQTKQTHAYALELNAHLFV